MEYKHYWRTVVETPAYLAIAGKLFSEEQRGAIISTIAQDPESGAVMAGTGGFRKIRVARKVWGRAVVRG